jgi:hypothetical protein
MLLSNETRTQLLDELSKAPRGTTFAPIYVEVGGKKVEVATRAKVVDGKSEDGRLFAFIEFPSMVDICTVDGGKAESYKESRGSYRVVEDTLLPEPEEIKALRKELEGKMPPHGYEWQVGPSGAPILVKTTRPGAAKPGVKPPRATGEKRARSGSFSQADVGKVLQRTNGDKNNPQVVSEHKVIKVTADGKAVVEKFAGEIPAPGRYWKRK